MVFFYIVFCVCQNWKFRFLLLLPLNDVIIKYVLFFMCFGCGCAFCDLWYINYIIKIKNKCLIICGTQRICRITLIKGGAWLGHVPRKIYLTLRLKLAVSQLWIMNTKLDLRSLKKFRWTRYTILHIYFKCSLI